MFGFIKKSFVTAVTFFGCNVLNVNPLKCISMNNKERRGKPNTININSNEPLFYPYSIKINRYSSCNDINDPYAKLCVPDAAKGIIVKVFNLMSRTNETRYIGWHKTCRCRCRLNANVCNKTQRWNKDKCRYGCKGTIDKGSCDKELIWNPSNCDCGCDEACDVGEYIDYKYCKCRKSLIDKLLEERSENNDGNEIISNKTLNDYGKIYGSCTIYIVLSVIFFMKSIKENILKQHSIKHINAEYQTN